MKFGCQKTPFVEPLPGLYDMWSMDPLLEGGCLYCPKVSTLVYYALSPRTFAIKSYGYDKQNRWVQLLVYGPVADFPDKYGEQRLYVMKRVQAIDIRSLPLDIQKKLAHALFEKVNHADIFFNSHKSVLTARTIKSWLGLPEA